MALALPSAPQLTPARLQFQRCSLRQRDATAYDLTTLRGSPYIRLRLGGRRGLFLLDTGANISGVDQAWLGASELHRRAAGFVATQGTTGGYLASAARLSTRLELGNGFFDAPRFLLQDFSRFAQPQAGAQAGLIGTDLLNAYRLVLDYPRRRAALRLRHERRALPGHRATTLRYERSLPTVTLRLDGLDFPCTIDTGSNNRRRAPSLDVNRALVERLASAGVELHERGRIAMAGITGCEHRRVLGLVELELAGRRFPGAELIVHERGPLDGPEPCALMGAGLLERLGRVVIDPFERLIWIARGA